MEPNANISDAKKLLKESQYAKAFDILRKSAFPDSDFSVQHKLSKMYSSIPGEEITLTPIKIAIVPTCTIESFKEIFRMWLAFEGFNAEIFMAEYDTLQPTVLDPNSELYKFQPDIAWLFTTHRDVRELPAPGAGADEVNSLIEENISSISSLWHAIKNNCSSFIVQNNVDVPMERPFGNYEASSPWSRQNFLKRFNYELSNALEPGITIFDIEYLAASLGKEKWYSPRYWYHSKHAFSFDAIGRIAFGFSKLVSSIKGLSKKCVVLDLDNTLWGGVIGDDGLEGIKLGNGPDGEAFVDFQKYILSLKNRGIILTVCSKNNEENAILPFEQHPDMVLKKEDIAVFIANWNNKADNIKEIAGVLDIGIDSMVFIDDNPFERNLVTEILPEVVAPDLPADPAMYVRYVDSLRLFETISFSSEDKARSDMYKENAERKKVASSAASLEDYLKDLRMESHVGIFDKFNLPRIAQLINKSNQFHLTTTRYTETQLMEFMGNENNVCLYFKLKDRFGDNGLISALVLEKRNLNELHIDTWVMSCRVLSRGMEEFILSELVQVARKLNCSRIVGKYKPTKKNKLVSDLYERLGFTLVEDFESETLWGLQVEETSKLPDSFIKKQIDG